MVPEERIELSTYPLPRGCATTTLLRQIRRRAGGYSPRVVRGKGFIVGNSSDKSERLAAALRENLKRRKARARALETADTPGPSDNQKSPSGTAAKDA